MVTVVANGKQEVVSIKLDPQCVDARDIGMLEDLIVAATNQALAEARALAQKEFGAATGMPNLPGMPFSELSPRVWQHRPIRSRNSPNCSRGCRASASAARNGLHFISCESSPDYARDLSDAISRVVRGEVKFCSRCCNLTPVDPCSICGDPRRDDRLLCVVESVQDLVAVERTREFKGRYHVLHGSLSPLDGIGPDQLKMQEMIAQLHSGVVEEVILATNPTVEGEATALYLARLLKPFGLRISRIAQGVAQGVDLEYADQVTLARAVAGRREF